MMTPNDGAMHGEDFGGHGQSIFFHPSVDRATASLDVHAPVPNGHAPLHPNAPPYVTPPNTHAPTPNGHAPLHPNAPQYVTPPNTHAPAPNGH